MLEATLQRAVRAAKRAWDAPEGVAGLECFQEPSTPALVLMLAARRRLGPEATRFEPETLWQELKPHPLNQDKLLAAHALDTYPAFYWDARVLGATCLAFCEESPLPDVVPHPTPEQLAWGVVEARLIFALLSDVEPEYDAEVAAYVAHLLHDWGWVAAPEGLEFADEALQALLNPEAKKLRATVPDTWRARMETNPEAVSFEEDTPQGVQQARQASVYVYVLKRAEALLRALEGL